MRRLAWIFCLLATPALADEGATVSTGDSGDVRLVHDMICEGGEAGRVTLLREPFTDRGRIDMTEWTERGGQQVLSANVHQFSENETTWRTYQFESLMLTVEVRVKVGAGVPVMEGTVVIGSNILDVEPTLVPVRCMLVD